MKNLELYRLLTIVPLLCLFGISFSQESIDSNYFLREDIKAINSQPEIKSSPAFLTVNEASSVIYDDFLINDDAMGKGPSQNFPAICMGENGNYVIAWADYRNGNWDIFFQQFDPQGNPLASPCRVNDDKGIEFQGYPAIALNKLGDFIICWFDYRKGYYDIFYQCYNSLGVAQGQNNELSNEDHKLWFVDTDISVQINDIGNSLITWADARTGKYDIYYQLIDETGNKAGEAIKINEDLQISDQIESDIAVDAHGNFIIAWMNAQWIKDIKITFQRINAYGNKTGVNVKVIDTSLSDKVYSYLSIDLDVQGNFIIVWGNYYEVFFNRFSQTGIPMGESVKVNISSSTSQGVRSASIRMNENGSFVIVWDSGQYFDEAEIFFQRYDSTGTKLGDFIKVTNNASAFKGKWAITSDRNNKYVFIWLDKYIGQNRVFYQFYSTNGIKIGETQRLDSDNLDMIHQSQPVVAICKNNSFTTAWVDYRNGHSDIFCQRYDSLGSKLGDNYRVNDSEKGSRGNPSIAMDADGNFIIAWIDSRVRGNDVYYQCFDHYGKPIENNKRVNMNYSTYMLQSPSVVISRAGDFIITWMQPHSPDSYSDSGNIYYQRFINYYMVLEGVTIVNNNQSTEVDNKNPTIAMNEKGQFIIAWKCYNVNIPSDDIYFQRFSSSGSRIGTNAKANDVGTGGTEHPSIALFNNGKFIITWTDFRKDTGNWNVYLQRFNESGVKQGTTSRINDVPGFTWQFYPNIAFENGGNSIVVWQDYRNSRDNPDIIGQRFHPDGSPWGNNIRIVTDGPGHGEIAPKTCANSNRITFVWLDNRRSKGWDVFGKICDWNWEGESISNVISDKNRQIDPKAILVQNYPNPFNPTTTIEFDLPMPEKVSLKIFTLRGEEVANLLSGELSAGPHKVIWNASRNANGVYFYVLQAGSYREVRKAILIK